VTLSCLVNLNCETKDTKTTFLPVSESEYRSWIKARSLYAMVPGDSKCIDISNIGEAIEAMARPKTFLSLDFPLEDRSEQIEDDIANHATGFEYQTNLAAARDPALIEIYGALTLVNNNGRKVQIFLSSLDKNGLSVDELHVEIDGMLLCSIRTDTILLNEAMRGAS
jgi:hypothetical protein